jgi:ribokinase
MNVEKKIVVIGSINIDYVCQTVSLPRLGETVLGGNFLTAPGGKGANQAVAAAKLARAGTRVYFVGRAGDDATGSQLTAGLRQHGVCTEYVSVCAQTSSGVAMILVNKSGENCIAVSSGANAKLTPADIDATVDLIRSASCVVLQLEIPIPTVAHAVRLCRRLGVYTILDAGPVPPDGLPPAVYDVDLFTPNETEAEMLLDRRTVQAEPAEPEAIARSFLARGSKTVVLKQGSRGATAVTALGEVFHCDAYRVNVVDSTAAGDAFTGALAVARAEGMALRDMVQFANRAGALCCTAAGAQPSLPTREAVDRFCESKKQPA